MLSKVYQYTLFIGDMILVNVAFLVALLLHFDFCIPGDYWAIYLQIFFVLSLINLATNLCFKVYKCLLRYMSIHDFTQLIASNLLSTLLFYIYTKVYPISLPNGIYLIYLLILILFTLGSRISVRLIIDGYRHLKALYRNTFPIHDTHSAIRTMLVGAGTAANILIKDMNLVSSHRQIILAVDDSKLKQSHRLIGIPVLGNIEQIPQLARIYDIEEIIIAIPSASKKRITEIINICSHTTCKLMIFPGLDHSLTTNLLPIRQVNIDDLLCRDPIHLDNHIISTLLSDRTILVTGGGGSIGSELCRQISKFNPKLLIIFDIYENNAYDIQNELLLNGISKTALKIIIGSVRDKEKLEYVFKTYSPHIVFHAAAHKHVPLMEDNPEEAVKNNIFGTLNVALFAKKYKTSKFVFISTDKAVNPTNVMGATKRACEMIIQSINQTTSDTDYVAVRFGNVLGSNGSVIPLFKKQLEHGGPLTVTHPEVIRYFMTIPEAVSLILQAMTFASGGEIFILDMGAPVKIYDLALNFIKLSGLEPYKDIDIIFTGLRPGEKLYEELLLSEEGLSKTDSNKIFIAQPSTIDFNELLIRLEELSHSLADPDSIRQSLAHIVPTYTQAKK